MTIKGIDNGYGYTKDESMNVFRSAYTKEEPVSLYSGHKLTVNNSSYMILQGSNVSNFDSLKLEFTNLNYTVDDLLNLKRYHSLNLLSYEQGYWAGITALPKPLI